MQNGLRCLHWILFDRVNKFDSALWLHSFKLNCEEILEQSMFTISKDWLNNQRFSWLRSIDVVWEGNIYFILFTRTSHKTSFSRHSSQCPHDSTTPYHPHPQKPNWIWLAQNPVVSTYNERGWVWERGEEMRQQLEGKKSEKFGVDVAEVAVKYLNRMMCFWCSSKCGIIRTIFWIVLEGRGAGYNDGHLSSGKILKTIFPTDHHESLCGSREINRTAILTGTIGLSRNEELVRWSGWFEAGRQQQLRRVLHTFSRFLKPFET